MNYEKCSLRYQHIRPKPPDDVQTTEKDITPGIIAVIQSFGSRINFHPHLHFLVTEGGTDKKGQIHKVFQFNDPLRCRFFTLEVFSLLLEKKLINKDLVQKILHWRHTGFNVHFICPKRGGTMRIVSFPRLLSKGDTFALLSQLLMMMLLNG